MSYQPSLFDAAQPVLPMTAPRAASDKQIAYAKALAAKTGKALPAALFRDRAALSAWIDAAKPSGRFANYPSAKQVQFAERIARLKRRQIPDECFKDRGLMSAWIDGHRP